MFASLPLFFFNFFHTIFILCSPIVLVLKDDLKQIPFFLTNNRAKHWYPQSSVSHYRKRGSSPWLKRWENETRGNKRAIDAEEEEEEEEEEEAEGVAKDAGFRIEGFGERIRLSFDDTAGSWFEDTVAPRRLGFPLCFCVYKSKPDRKQGAQPEQSLVKQGGSHREYTNWSHDAITGKWHPLIIF